MHTAFNSTPVGRRRAFRSQFSLSTYVCYRNQILAISFGSKYLYLLDQLTVPSLWVLNTTYMLMIPKFYPSSD